MGASHCSQGRTWPERHDQERREDFEPPPAAHPVSTVPSTSLTPGRALWCVLRLADIFVDAGDGGEGREMDVRTRLEALSAAHLEGLLALIREVVGEAVPPDSTLVGMLSYHMGTGGKRLRALLPLAVADALEAQPAQLVPFGAACELLHNATLVHDDLQDGDEMRRDQEAVWKRYGAAQAINLGDAMLYLTLALVHRLQGAFGQEAMLRCERRVLRGDAAGDRRSGARVRAAGHRAAAA